MKILVTGGTGYIGSHTVIELLNRQYQVVILDNLSNSKPEVVDLIEQISGQRPDFIEGDIRDTDLLEKIFQAHSISAVIHFAGLKAVGESVQKPLAYYDNNISGTVNLLEVMQRNNCRKMVFSSSATVYGENPNVPFKEEYPTATTNPYGATKRMIEDILNDLYVSDERWSIAILRYFNPIGAHQSGLIGENPNGIPNNLFPYICKVATGELDQLQVFGDDYDTVDGTGVRDYIHVVDLADGHLAALHYILDKAQMLTVNLGSGKGTSVLELVHAFEQASGKKVSYTVGPRRAGDIATCYADTGKAKSVLNWQTQKTVAQMCEDGWRFIESHQK